MKNLIKKSLLIVVLFTGMVTTAMSNDFEIGVSLIDSKFATINFKNFDGDLEVYVKDSYGLILYKEKFEGSVFSKKYDLTSLPNGNYFFEISGQTKIKVLPFEVNENSVAFKKEKELIHFKPIVRKFRDNIFSVSMIALNNENLEITIYDTDSNLIYKEEIQDQDEAYLGRMFNLSNLESGNYKLIMKSENRMFEQTIKKRK